MKRLALAMMIIPFAASAQTGGMHIDQAKLQELMQGAKRAQACMANIDQKAMDEFKRKTSETEAEIKALCAAGKRDAAMARAMKFKDEAAQSQVMQQTRKCTEEMAGMMPNQSSTIQPRDNSGTPRHICDK